MPKFTIVLQRTQVAVFEVESADQASAERRAEALANEIDDDESLCEWGTELVDVRETLPLAEASAKGLVGVAL